MTEPFGPPVWAFAIYPDDVREYQSPVALLVQRPSDEGWIIYPYDATSLDGALEELAKREETASYGDLVEFLRVRHFHTKAIVWPNDHKPTVFYAR